MFDILNSQQFLPFTTVSVLVFGMITGSFLNVVIYRVPIGKSIVTPPSSCTNCGHQIKWYENIPVISWLFLRGKCSGCSQKISVIYPLIELLNGFLYVLAFFRFGISAELPFIFYFISAMTATAIIDFKTQDVYSLIVLPLIVFGVVRAFLTTEITWVESLVGVAVGGGILLLAIGVFYIVTKKIGMGLGDVYILASIGAFTGVKYIPMILLTACLTGIIFFFAAKLIFKKKVIAENLKKEDLNTDNEQDLEHAIYFGPFLALAGIAVLLCPTIILNMITGFNY
jgi:leader peptidase (prepilin peptidase)/N-methyltransferase